MKGGIVFKQKGHSDTKVRKMFKKTENAMYLECKVGGTEK